MNYETRLQAVLATSSSGVTTPPWPHHPITCLETLTYDAAGIFACPHAKAEPNDRRTRECLNHSVAILLLELAALL